MYLRPVIFANSSGSRNSRNKGHAKNTGFTVLELTVLQKVQICHVVVVGVHCYSIRTSLHT